MQSNRIKYLRRRIQSNRSVYTGRRDIKSNRSVYTGKRGAEQ